MTARSLAASVRRAIRRPFFELTAEPAGVEIAPDNISYASFGLRPRERERLPDGWVQITVRCEAGQRPIELSLLCTYDDEGLDSATHSLVPFSSGVSVTIVHVRGEAYRWELRTTNQGSEDVALTVAVLELTRPEALLRKAANLAVSRQWHARDAGRLVRKAGRILREEGHHGIIRRLHGQGANLPSAEVYARWIIANEPRPERDHAAMRRRIASMKKRPRFSVVMPTYNTAPVWLERAIGSVREQLWSDWELCIADDASTSAETRRALEAAAVSDKRIRVVFRERNGHISEASNSALAIATGDYVVLLDHDDELAPHALYMMAEYIDRNPEAVVLYSDEDKIDEQGRRYDPYFKPDWNPDLLTSQNYISHLGVYRREVLERIGGFRKGFEGSQDYDLVLRATETCRRDQIVHVPFVLYHWRSIPGSTALAIDEKSYAVLSARKAVREHLERRGVRATVEPAWRESQFHRVRYDIPSPPPLASIVICTRDRVDLLKTAVESVSRLTEYPRFEIVVVDNQSRDEATLAYLSEIAERPAVRVLRYDEPFNFAALNNFAAQHCASDVLVLLNNDIEVINAGWLTELVSHAMRPEVGCVGALLYYPDSRIQHAGVVLGVHGIAGHIHRLLSRGAPGYFGRAALIQNYSVVTAACVAVRRSVFQEVGGLDPTFAVAFNDVDFCMRVRDRGYLNVWTPYAELYHYESASRGSDMAPDKRERFKREIGLMRKRWGSALLRDPAYNPNLRLDDTDFGLARESRTQKPWHGEAHPGGDSKLAAAARD